MIRLFRISHPIRSHGNELDLYHLLWRLPECWNSHPASGPLSDLWHLRHEALYMQAPAEQNQIHQIRVALALIQSGQDAKTVT